MNTPDAAARREVAARGLTPDAVAHLTRDALGRVGLEHLAAVKGLVKRFFSSEPWTAAEAQQLADLVGPGQGWWRYPLDDDYALAFGWRDAFTLEIEPIAMLDETFAESVVPEATPNPRTIRFVTGSIHDGPSRWYEGSDGVDDPRVAHLFTNFDDVANVLVGPDFVAVGLRRSDRWEDLLGPILRAVNDQFMQLESSAITSAPRPATPASRAEPSAEPGGALSRAWQELGRDPELGRVIDAISSPDLAMRQVAARHLVGAELDPATTAWSRLLDDTSRSVRRAVVDAMVDDERPQLRPLLERALRDSDAWTRWKALRGIATLGVGESRDAVAALAEDHDFRVRLEVASALRAR